MQKLIQQIEQWAEDRNLIRGSTPQKQMLKLMEEFGELCGGVAKNKPELIKDSIGDCFVVLVILNKQMRFMQLDKYQPEPEIDFGNTEKTLISLMRDMANLKLNFELHPADYMTLDAYNDTLDETLFAFRCVVSYLARIAKLSNLELKECVQHAYDQIKDRKGKMIDGVFVKEGDL